MKADHHDPDPQNEPAPRKAGWLQVAATIFWGLFMIGRKGTWERNGATVTLAQTVVGAAIGIVVVVCILILLVRLATG